MRGIAVKQVYLVRESGERMGPYELTVTPYPGLPGTTMTASVRLNGAVASEAEVEVERFWSGFDMISFRILHPEKFNGAAIPKRGKLTFIEDIEAKP